MSGANAPTGEPVRLRRKKLLYLSIFNLGLSASVNAACLRAYIAAEVQARKAQALAARRTKRGQPRMTKNEIRALVDALGNLSAALANADPEG